MRGWLHRELRRRPWWANALLLFCAYMALVDVPMDLFLKPVASDEEVWFGIRSYAWTAKLLAIPHWIVYSAGLYGFWTLARWMHPWAAVYALQVLISMVVWPVLYKEGPTRYLSAALLGASFGWVPWLLWRARDLFQPPIPPVTDR